jgi:hypothetical protein
VPRSGLTAAYRSANEQGAEPCATDAGSVFLSRPRLTLTASSTSPTGALQDAILCNFYL